MKITRNDGSTDYAVLLPEDWKRLQGYSEKQNRKWDNNAHAYVNGNPNDLYVADGGQIDKGFLIAKLIKHAFKTYPKARVGRGTQLESQQTDEEISNDIYGLGNGEAVDTTTGEVIQTKENFGPAADTSAGVVVNPAETGNTESATNDDVF